MRVLLLESLLVVLLNACTSNTNEQKADSTALADSGAAVVNDWECIPGERAGIITSRSSEQELIDKLGEANVSAHDTIYGAEGMFSIGTIIYKGTPNEAHIVWKDTLNFKNPDYVEVGFIEPGKESQVKWYVTNGVKVGTKLTELELINGKPFNFSGFGWDYGGSVVDWNGGKLMNSDSTSYLSIILAYDYENQALNSIAEKVMGDKSFESKDPNAQMLNPFVSHFIISFK
ncbi:hypothetical protein [Emticicia sp. C21]|uniref:hypothetical protein n=1 Tax=Emticicia sp. C21 TaxID=2302915 RepID=UPI000E341D34|nr:hypothetical protein [Emticicia sp. C21]RFS18458.1 hypothetical protein D0T08_04190 [Emticicia sp. C21]